MRAYSPPALLLLLGAFFFWRIGGRSKTDKGDIQKDGLLPEGRVGLDAESNPAMYSSGDRRFMLRFGKQDGGRVDLQREHTNLTWIASVSGLEAGGAVNIATLNKSSSRCTLMVGDRFLAQNQAGYIMQGHMTNLYRREIDGPGSDEVVFHYRIEAETHPQRVVAI
jgi:hypothetical protein